MKRHWNQAAAFFLAASIVLGSGSFAAFAEEPQTEAGQEETYAAELWSEEPASETADTEKESDTMPEVTSEETVREEITEEAALEPETEPVSEEQETAEQMGDTALPKENVPVQMMQKAAAATADLTEETEWEGADFPIPYPDEFYLVAMFKPYPWLKPGETGELEAKVNRNYYVGGNYVDGELHVDPFFDFYVDWVIIEGEDVASIEVNKEDNKKAYLTVNENADNCKIRIEAHIMHQNEDGSVEEIICWNHHELVISVDVSSAPIKEVREGADGKLYYYVGDEIDTEFEGIPDLDLTSNKYYIKNGMVATDMNGLYLIEDERNETMTGDKYYFFKAGEVDGYGGHPFTGLVEHEDGTKYYIDYGEVKTDLNGLHWVEQMVKENEITRVSTSYFFTDGKINTDFEGIILDTTLWKYYIKNGTIATDLNGLHFIADELDETTTGNQFYYFDEGWVCTYFAGLTEYDGSKFYIKDGTVATDMSGLHLVEDVQDGATTGNKFYFFARGQVQSKYKGLALYDHEWFYLENGYLDTNMSGIVEYDGGKFIVAVGRIAREASGLWQNPKNGKWYFASKGHIQTQHTGVAAYDGAMFYVRNGELAKDYKGTIKHNGITYKVINGQLYKKK